MSATGGVWLLLGPERGEKDAFLDSALSSLRKSAGSDVEVQKLYPFDTRMVDLVALLCNGSLFAPHRAVILGNAEAVKGQTEAAILADYCAAPAPGATLFLLSDEVGDISSRVLKAVPKDRQKIFWEMFEGRKVEWVKAFFRKRRVDVDQETIEFILETVENNTHDLQAECGRLADYFGSAGRVTLEQAQTYLYHGRQENAFTLFDRLAVRDFAGCLEVLDKILLAREAEPFAILGGLLWQVRKLHAFHLLVADNYAPDEAIARLGVRSKKSQRTYLEARRLYSREQVEALVLLIADTDRRIRMGRAETHRLLMEMFLYRAITERPFGPVAAGAHT
jgi:DNA polymerase III subunit delta